MQKTFLMGLSAAALVLATSTASFAGSFAEAEIEPEVFVVEETEAAGSLGGLGGTGVLVGVLAIAAIAALASSSSSSSTTTLDVAE